MADTIKKLQENLRKVIVGKEEVIDFVITSLLAGGHVLLEDMPGTGKTVLAKSLAKSIDGAFSRVQMTPDLLPSDITGLNIYDQKEAAFRFHAGPVFTNILLADEINRATPRTQASLLECMEEHQVTVDGETRKLEEPFFVIATQNPIETAGTFPLPEAQMDRFLMRLSMGSVSITEEIEILNRYLEEKPFENLESVLGKDEILEIQREVTLVYVHPQLRRYISEISAETRNKREILLGISPRGTLALLKASQAYAYMQGRKYVVPEDIKTVACPVLAHRIILEGGFAETQSCIRQIQCAIDAVSVPTEEWNKEV